jgi:hypothetical protein
LAGELRGATGWFPESYVELAESGTDDITANVINANDTATTIVPAADPEALKRPLE